MNQKLIKYLDDHRLIDQYLICDDHVWLLQKHSSGAFITCCDVKDFDGKLRGMKYEWKGFDHTDCPASFLKVASIVHDAEWRRKITGYMPRARVRNRAKARPRTRARSIE